MPVWACFLHSQMSKFTRWIELSIRYGQIPKFTRWIETWIIVQLDPRPSIPAGVLVCGAAAVAVGDGVDPVGQRGHQTSPRHLLLRREPVHLPGGYLLELDHLLQEPRLGPPHVGVQGHRGRPVLLLLRGPRRFLTHGITVHEWPWFHQWRQTVFKAAKGRPREGRPDTSMAASIPASTAA